jgi:hypothetical protein
LAEKSKANGGKAVLSTIRPTFCECFCDSLVELGWSDWFAQDLGNTQSFQFLEDHGVLDAGANHNWLLVFVLLAQLPEDG